MIYRLSMSEKLKNIMRDTVCRRFLHHIVLSYYILDNVCRTFMRHIVVSYYIKATDVRKMVTRCVVNYYILPIDVNAVARQNVVITTFCNVTTFWVATERLAQVLVRRNQFPSWVILCSNSANLDLLVYGCSNEHRIYCTERWNTYSGPLKPCHIILYQRANVLIIILSLWHTTIRWYKNKRKGE